MKTLTTFLRLHKTNLTAVGMPLMFIVLVTVSCKLPLDFLPFMGGEGKLEDELAADGLLAVDEVRVEEDQLVITYQERTGGELESMVAGWLYALEKAVKSSPGAQQIILRTTLSDDPYLEVTAAAEDVRAFFSDQITDEEFLEALEIEDQRPVDQILTQALIEYGLDLTSVTVTDGTVEIEYYQAPMDDRAALIEEWMDILYMISEEGLPSETIRLRSVMLDTSVFVVEVAVEDLEAFYRGERTMFELLAGLEITEEPCEVGE